MPTPRESKLLIYLIMALGLVLGFLYANGLDPAATIEPLPVKLQASALQSIRAARIDDTILKSEAFKSLRVFGSLPVEPSAGGKSNLFQ